MTKVNLEVKPKFLKGLKFRGNTIKHGVWVHGFHWEAPDRTNYIRNMIGDQIMDYKVHPGLVGFTFGHKDDNGKDVFTGDIIDSSSSDLKGVVGFDGTKFNVDTKEGIANLVYPLDAIASLKIIGKYIENPELLED